MSSVALLQCRKSNLFVLRSETWNDSKTSPAVAHGAKLQPYLCWVREMRNQCQMWTFTLSILRMWTSQLFFYCFVLICSNAERFVKTDPSQGSLSWPQHITRVPFLKWIFRLFILFYIWYSIFNILYSSDEGHESCNRHVHISYWKQAVIMIEANSM